MFSDPFFHTPRSRYSEDRDTRPVTQPCRVCARDVENGHKCICVPSAPLRGNVVITPHGYTVAED